MSSNNKPTTSMMGSQIREFLCMIIARLETMTPEQYAKIEAKHFQHLTEYLEEIKAGLEENNPTIHKEES
jgi:hypothetical protein